MISVVLPVLDGADHLREALESAPAAGADEVVVVDGGSSDDSREIAAGFDFVELREQRGPGLPDAYNEGIATADPVEVAFLDGLIALRGEGDEERAAAAFDRFLELAPDDPRAPMIRSLRDEAESAP